VRGRHPQELRIPHGPGRVRGARERERESERERERADRRPQRRPGEQNVPFSEFVGKGKYFTRAGERLRERERERERALGQLKRPGQENIAGLLIAVCRLQVCVCVSVCVYIYIYYVGYGIFRNTYIYMYTHTHTHTHKIMLADVCRLQAVVRGRLAQMLFCSGRLWFAHSCARYIIIIIIIIIIVIVIVIVIHICNMDQSD